jgi:hypothetical protein
LRPQRRITANGDAYTAAKIIPNFPAKPAPFGHFSTLSLKSTETHTFSEEEILRFSVENRPFKVKSGSGVGNHPSEESAKVIPECLKD